eukprot:TRINITY_DN67329_c8_g1_i1.p1 TRINITY_DN67329_c8_g1~~TRINITY_DN67329_c8_g1_i1.p1  ORF type:complete len:219 (-),score=5.74 TRINITY_DN67329_c8_g1_i1:727-1383(-)
MTLGYSGDASDLIFKVCVVGEVAVGKTTLIHRYTSGKVFAGILHPTIGVDFMTKPKQRIKNYDVTLNVWDVAGNTKYDSVMPQYLRGVNGIFIVYALDDDRTMREAINHWKPRMTELTANSHFKVPIYLIGSKCDRRETCEISTPQEMEDCIQNHGFDRWFKTTSKIQSNHRIDDAFEMLAEDMVQAYDDSARIQVCEPHPTPVSVSRSNKKQKQGCC